MVKKQKQYSYLTPEQIKVVEGGQKRREEDKETREFQKALEEEEARTTKVKILRGGKKISSKAKRFKSKLFTKKGGGRRASKVRERQTRGILTATGITGGSQRYSGPGRPRGTYKYGMPIQEYKKKLSRKKALYEQFKDRQQIKLQKRGLTPDQIRQLQLQRSIDELEQPTKEQLYAEYVQKQQKPRRRVYVQRQRPMNNKKGYPQFSQEIADDELEFTKWRADNTVSPNTQRLLTQIRRIQNKGKADNINQQRRHWERRLVEQNTNLMRAHENMTKINLDFTGVNPEENILMAQNVFKENPEQGSILRTERFNIMQTREAGNNLKFF